MKSLGIILVIICLGVNVFIGHFLYTKSQNPQGAKVMSIEELNKLPEQTHTYAVHGIEFTTPGKFISEGGDATTGVVDLLYSADPKDAWPPVIHVLVTPNKTDGAPSTSEIYKKFSEAGYTNLNASLVYRDGGFLMKGDHKIYYDVIVAKLPDVDSRLGEKRYSFFNKGNMYEIIWQDDEAGFDQSLPEFEKIFDTLKIQ